MRGEKRGHLAAPLCAPPKMHIKTEFQDLGLLFFHTRPCLLASRLFASTRTPRTYDKKPAIFWLTQKCLDGSASMADPKLRFLNRSCTPTPSLCLFTTPQK